jgi:putative DNA primase/helicase
VTDDLSVNVDNDHEDYDLTHVDDLLDYLDTVSDDCPVCRDDELYVNPVSHTLSYDRLDRFGVVAVWCDRCKGEKADLALALRKAYGIPKDAPLVSLSVFDTNGSPLALSDPMARQLARVQRFRPNVFRLGGTLSTVAPDGKVSELSPTALAVRMAEVSKFYNGSRYLDPPASALRAIRLTAEDQLAIPRLDRVVTTPVVMTDGRILTTPGYDAASCTYYAPALPAVVVPEHVTQDDVDAAVRLLTVDLFGDIDFVGPADLANALAATVQPFVRSQIVGPCPLFNFDAPTPGSQKTLACSLALMPGCGFVTPTSWHKAPKEQVSTLLSVLLKAPTAVLIDNVTGSVSSEALEAILTTPSGSWTARILTTNRMGEVPVHQTFTMTTNNGTFGTSMRRRVIPIRIDSGEEHPDKRIGPSKGARAGQPWLHPELMLWASEHRADLVTACLTLCRSWFQQGQPAPTIPPDAVRGSYERWQHVLGGILQAAGISGFCENIATVDGNDPEIEEIAEQLRLLETKFGVTEFTSKEAVATGVAGEANAQSFGMSLRGIKDRPAQGLVLRLVERRGTANAWKVVAA